MKTAQQFRFLNIDFRFLKKKNSLSHSVIRNQKSRFYASSEAFTLVELLVGLTILATLAGGVLLTLNPIAQINKSQDAKKQTDIQAVKNALELYYNDTKCYPKSVPFGSDWIGANGTVYMKKVPQDPKCVNQGICYRYKTDVTKDCPQWSVVFSQLTKESSLTNACAVSSLSNCAPAGYANNSWACVMSGAVDCDYLLTKASLNGNEAAMPTAVPTLAGSLATPTSSPTPSPTPAIGPDDGYYTIGVPENTNPIPKDATIMPLWQVKGLGQQIRVTAIDLNSDITSVKLVRYFDDGSDIVTLTQSGGTLRSGTWSGAWSVAHTYYKQYGYDVVVSDKNGNTSKGEIRVR